jgi:hypothetical protein
VRGGRLAVAGPLTGVVLALAGCYPVDPTERSFNVPLLNDSGRTLVVSGCEHADCTGKTFDTGILKSGHEWPDVFGSVGEAHPLLVRSRTGQRLGCIPMFFDYNPRGTTFTVSELMVPCGSHYEARHKPNG